jgi:chromosome segregation ATPase
MMAGKDISKQLDDIKDQLDEHTKTLSSVDKTLALQAQSLENHVKRTNIAEENIALLREEFKPVQKHVNFVNSLSKLITILGTLLGIVYVVWAMIYGKM